MEFYSANTDLKKTFGEEINDAEYISELNKLCQSSNAYYENSARFVPHNLLTNWNETVESITSGFEDLEDFDFDLHRNILYELENNTSLNKYNEHGIFLKILESIDEKLKAQTFIPKELENEKRWWNCIVFKKGTKEYIDRVEKDMLDKFNIKMELKNRIEKI